jgi:hypothetical protein
VLATLTQLSFSPVVATQVRDKVYAAFILNFARNIEWPKEKKSGDFIIGVVNSASVAAELKNETTHLKNLHNQPIAVKEFSSASEADFCHILFIPDSDDVSLTALLNKLSDTPTLIVTAKEGLAKKGSGINFLMVEGKLKFELNSSSFEKRRLKPSEDLQRFSILIP